MSFLKSRWKALLAVLAVVGPGIITAAVDNDAGGIATYSVAGANYGYAFLWMMIPIAILLIVIQEIPARLGAVTGKGLAELIRENFGLKITFYTMLILVLANICNVIANFAGIVAGAEIFGINRILIVPLAVAFVIILVFKGNYQVVEKAFLGMIVFYLCYVVAGLMAGPDWAFLAGEAVKPHIEYSFDFMLVLVALIGTTIAPWMQFYLQAAIVEKGVRKEHLSITRMDVISGSIVTIIVMFFIIVTCAMILYPAGVRVETAGDAAQALVPLAGQYAAGLFALGLLAASLFAAAIIPLSTAFTVCEGLGWDAGIDRKIGEAPQFYFIFAATIFFSAGLILLPGIPLLAVMVVSQALNGLLLPIVVIFMLLIANNKEVMGEYRNGPILNIIGIGSAAAASIAALLLVFMTFFPAGL